MILSKLANEYLTDRIRIGTSVGKGFIYQGTWSGFRKWIRSANPGDYKTMHYRRSKTAPFARASDCDFPEREIIDQYPSTIDKETLIIIIDGLEMGEYTLK